MEKKSGKHWVEWANINALNNQSINTLESNFRINVENFIKALTDAGVTVKIEATRRSDKRAYLFHWSWKISCERCKPSEPTKMEGVDIEWDHGDEKLSIESAKEMVAGFGLALPPNSIVAPALSSNHITGKAIDMNITCNQKITVKKKDGKELVFTLALNPNNDDNLIAIGKSYDVLKLKTDRPHWSYNGR